MIAATKMPPSSAASAIASHSGGSGSGRGAGSRWMTPAPSLGSDASGGSTQPLPSGVINVPPFQTPLEESKPRAV